MFLWNEKKYSDKQIIQGLKADKVAFEKSASVLYRKCIGFVGDFEKKYSLLSREDLDDAYIDSLQSVIQKIVNGSFDESKGKISTLIYQIFSNKCVDQIRRNTNHKSEWEKNLDIITEDLPVASKSFLKELMIGEEFQTVVDTLGQLGNPCQELIMDFDYWGFSPDEVAKKLNYKTGKSASQAKFRCMESLRKLLEKRAII
jgi:RNA polymerase sigma-70 factor (ECF subfamily)